MGNIVLIDSDANYQAEVRKIVAPKHHLQASACAQHFLRSAQDLSIDVILINERLPDMGAYELCALIKSQPALAELPVIILSNNAEPMGKARAFMYGFDDYVAKTSSPTELLMVIDIALSEHYEGNKGKAYRTELERLDDVQTEVEAVV